MNILIKKQQHIYKIDHQKQNFIKLNINSGKSEEYKERLNNNAGLFHKLRSYGTSGQIFGLISSFLSNRRLQLVVDGKSSQGYPVIAGVSQGSILDPTLFLLYINDLPDDVIFNITIYADDTTLF